MFKDGRLSWDGILGITPQHRGDCKQVHPDSFRCSFSVHRGPAIPGKKADSQKTDSKWTRSKRSIRKRENQQEDQQMFGC